MCFEKKFYIPKTFLVINILLCNFIYLLCKNDIKLKINFIFFIMVFAFFFFIR